MSAPFICQGYISALFEARPKGTDVTHLSLLNPGSAEPVFFFGFVFFFLCFGARVSPPTAYLLKFGGKPFSKLAETVYGGTL